MQFNLLGPLEVTRSGQQLPLSGVNQRAVLGFLLLHANEVVATSQLLKALWNDGGPATARKILHNAVAGLRGVLHPSVEGTGSVALVTQAPGYVLQVEPHQLDLTLFQRRWEQGRAELAVGSYDRAAVLLPEALGLWRGLALADLTEAGIDWPELTAVQNARLAALEDCVEAQLAVGWHHEVVAMLETVVRTEPQRERLCGQLMLALYRSGRQSDALSVYRRTRDALVEELGLDPGRELRDLERAILEHDPRLMPRTGGGPAAEGSLLGRSPAGAPWPSGAGSISAPIISGALHRATGAAAPPAQVRTACKRVSALLVKAEMAGAPSGHDDEVERLHGLLSDVQQRQRPHVAVVLGESGTGKTRLIAEFARSVGKLPRSVRLLTGNAAGSARDTGLGALAGVIGSFAGIGETDDADAAEAKLADALRHLVGAGYASSWMLSQLMPVIAPEAMPERGDGSGALVASRRLMEELAARGPLVVVIENLHCAGDALFDFITDLATQAMPAPILVVTTARPELLRSKTRWGADTSAGAGRDATHSVIRLQVSARARARAVRSAGNPRLDRGHGPRDHLEPCNAVRTDRSANA